MRLSEDRISHISHLVQDAIIKTKLITSTHGDDKVLREIKHTITDELKFDDEVDTLVRRTIQSLSRRVPEGSPEWEVLYRKYREEELRRKNKL
ncbi:MAG: DUF507 family protein [Nitrospirota bacterium]|nr:DUF507 family protein [Nitrospirota bacterium]